MTNFLRSLSPVFIFLLALVVTSSGCDLGTYAQRAENASRNYKPPAMTKPDGSDKKEDDQPKGPVIAGSWGMDATATANLIQRRVNPIILGGPAAHKMLVKAIRNGSMEFDLKDDGTWTCKEILESQTADFRGKWTIKGDQIAIDQTHRGNKPEKDHLGGTVRGDKMDLEMAKQNIKLPIILVRR